MKKIFVFFIVLLFICSCVKKNDSGKSTSSIGKKIKVGLALGYLGIGDQSFNDMQFNGLIEASRKFDIDITYKVPENETEEGMIKILKDLVNENCDLIITSGYLMINPIKIVSKLYPSVFFVLLDDYAEKADNVLSVVYAQHEGSFVVGALAALFTKTGKIGFIGGVDIPVIKAFLKGFEEGIQYANPNTKLYVRYCSYLPDFSGFSSPSIGYKIACDLYDSGVDVIYSVAGGTGTGIIKAAEDKKKYVIGVDSNQDHLAKGYVLTSMMKRLDITVVDICEKFLKNELKGNTDYVYGYKNGGVSITPMEYTKELIGEEIIKKIKIIENKISNGEIIVTDLMRK